MVLGGVDHFDGRMVGVVLRPGLLKLEVQVVLFIAYPIIVSKDSL